ncbi:MAG: GLUG motif-containing protein [Planctomycetota bacterium]|jgi:hypothetical protein
MITKAEIITILAVLLFVYITDSAKAVINDVEITPDEPTTEDIITVVTLGTESTGPVGVIDTVVNITDSEIGLDLTLVVGPFLAETPWSYSVDIGRLSAGTYDLTVRTLSPSVVVDTYFKTFQVVPAPPMTLDGSGTQQDPWLIQSLDDFNEFTSIIYYWDDYTRLETDVNLAGMVYTTAVIAPDTDNSNYTFEGTVFTGVFDGNDHKILNLNIDDGGAGNDYLGLFGFINECVVRNLGIEGGSVSGDWYVGGLAGRNYKHVSNCYSTQDVSGNGAVGGLVGLNSGSISDCYSTGDVNGFDWVGGLASWNNSNISNCYSTGDVSGNNEVGGLVGENWSSISNCYSTGDVNGVDYVGGLVGSNGGWHPSLGAFMGYVFESYSTGSIQGISYVGGLVGYNELGDIEKSCWDIQTSNEPNMCGHQEEGATGCDPNYGLPTAELYQRSTFTDWDFINIWNIGENQTYPHLRVYLAGDINKDGITNFLDLNILCNLWMEEQ